MPHDEKGTILITPNPDPFDDTVGDASALIPLTTADKGKEYPVYADKDVLTNGGDPDGYKDKNFLPDGTNFNTHYPFQDSVSDFLIYNIGDFAELYEVSDYNADDGGSIEPGGDGQVKSYSIEVTDFSWVHVDAYGYEEINNDKHLRTSWEINPGSHDTTYYVPVTSSVLLGSIGVSLVGWLRRRKSI